MDKEQLLKSNHFCILPFVHACVWTNGKAIPCCVNHEYTLGNVNTTSIEKIFSPQNEKLVEIQQQMINGPELPSSCKACSVPEKSYNKRTYRYFSNLQYGHLLHNLDFDSENRVLTSKISLWDIRYSNLCNLKCRMCIDANSSSIAEESSRSKKGVQVLYKAFNDSTVFFDFFEKNLDYIEEIYFCGGEPLMLEEHYAILDLLIQHGKTSVVLRYNSNCTRLVFKDKNIIDYWQKFPNVKLIASVDAGWEQISLLRNGADWDTIVSNLLEIRKSFPDMYIQLNPTITLMNATHVERLHFEFHKLGIINSINDIYYNVLTFPVYYSLTTLPEKHKVRVANSLYLYKQRLATLGARTELLNDVMKMINYMHSEDTTHMLSEFISQTRAKDTIRKETTALIFPELGDILGE